MLLTRHVHQLNSWKVLFSIRLMWKFAVSVLNDFIFQFICCTIQTWQVVIFLYSKTLHTFEFTCAIIITQCTNQNFFTIELWLSHNSYSHINLPSSKHYYKIRIQLNIHILYNLSFIPLFQATHISHQHSSKTKCHHSLYLTSILHPQHTNVSIQHL